MGVLIVFGIVVILILVFFGMRVTKTVSENQHTQFITPLSEVNKYSEEDQERDFKSKVKEAQDYSAAKFNHRHKKLIKRVERNAEKGRKGLIARALSSQLTRESRYLEADIRATPGRLRRT